MRSYTSKLNGKSELIHQLREIGYSYRDIQRETGFSKGTISYHLGCLLYTSPSPRDGLLSRMPSSA